MTNSTDEDDLDNLPTTDRMTVTKSLTASFMFGRQTQYAKAEITETILPGETEQEFNDRTSLLVMRQAFQLIDSFKDMLKEEGI